MERYGTKAMGTGYKESPKRMVCMNKRIKQLVEQSGGEFWQRLENDAVNPEAYITFDPPLSLEKFVELIVRECAGKAYAGIGPDSLDAYDRGWQNGRNSASQVIKQHFGVE
jgi:hypothetical protein